MADKDAIAACLACGRVEPLAEPTPRSRYDNPPPLVLTPPERVRAGEAVWCFGCKAWREVRPDEGGEAWVLVDLPPDSPWHKVQGYPDHLALQFVPRGG